MAQQALLKIFGKASTFDRSRDALAWSLGIAANEYRSHRRKLDNRSMESADTALATLAHDEHPEAIAIRNDLTHAVRSVMANLRPQDLEAVLAAMFDAPRPSISSPAFRKRLQRGLQNARRLWEKRYGEG